MLGHRQCKLPPAGWWCSRRPDHDGPCAAYRRRFYGGGGTIHRSTELDVGVDREGNVVAVWYRCQSLPFKQYDADLSFAGSGNPTHVCLIGVEVAEC